MKISRIENYRIKKSDKYYKIIDELCFKSKNLYNFANYVVRQEFIKTSKEKEEGKRENANWLNFYDLCKMLKTEDVFKDLGSHGSQQILRLLDRNWKSFFRSIKDWKIHPSKYKGMPKMPKYLDKEGRYICVVSNQDFKIIDNYIHFGWKSLRSLNNTFKTHIPDNAKLMQLRFIPKPNEYKMELVYEMEVPENKKMSKRIASIDLGVDNLMTITTNCKVNPIVINGKPLKSINQYYNKQKAKMQSELKLKTGKNISNEIIRFTNKRNRKVDDYIHKATKKVIDFCIENNIDTLVCGYNAGWKLESNMSKKVNQKFISIPYLSIIQKLQYKCENNSIKFYTNEESYTSGTSFFDKEEPISENYNSSRRKFRGLFVTNKGELVNADVNGSYQIMKKVFPELIPKRISSMGKHPKIINI